jgi:hypothetical protein
VQTARSLQRLQATLRCRPGIFCPEPLVANRNSPLYLPLVQPMFGMRRISILRNKHAISFWVRTSLIPFIAPQPLTQRPPQCLRPPCSVSVASTSMVKKWHSECFGVLGRDDEHAPEALASR